MTKEFKFGSANVAQDEMVMYFCKFKSIVTQKNAFPRIHEVYANFLGVQERVLTFNEFKLSKIKLSHSYFFRKTC